MIKRNIIDLVIIKKTRTNNEKCISGQCRNNKSQG